MTQAVDQTAERSERGRVERGDGVGARQRHIQPAPEQGQPRGARQVVQGRLEATVQVRDRHRVGAGIRDEQLVIDTVDHHGPEAAM